MSFLTNMDLFNYFYFCKNNCKLGVRFVIIFFARPPVKQSMQIDGASVVK